MRRFTLLVFLLMFSFVLRAQKYPEPIYTIKGLAINGYDAVAYFSERTPVKGVENFHYEWNGSKWLFSSQENLDLFKADTDKYAPQYGGYCAWGMKNGYKAKTEPDAWTVHNGKLYLNYSKSIASKWVKDKEGYIKTADKNWKGFEKE